MDPASTPTDTRQRLSAARERLDARDLPGALALYEELLSGPAGQRADVLLTVSGDLGSTGHVARIVELIAPRYDAQRHGPAIGMNLLQAYIAVRDIEAAQHVLDILFSLNRPELEERLFGFSNAIADMALLSSGVPKMQGPPGSAELAEGEPGGPVTFKVALVNITRPVWFYGLESLAGRILPPKEGKLRRVAFAQLAVLGENDPDAAMRKPENEVSRISRALPAWLAETFYFSQLYHSLTTLGFVDQSDGSRLPMIFWTEWTVEGLRQLLETTPETVDYIFTGWLRHEAGDYEVLLRVWEVKKFRERKQFSARWNPGNADSELARLHSEIRKFMEWAPYPEGSGLAYAPPASPIAWLDALGASVGTFLVEKAIFPPAAIPPLGPSFDRLAAIAAREPAASLAWLTLRSRATALGLAPDPFPAAALSPNPIVGEAAAALGGA